MARRCGIKNGKSVCQKPRANWWRAAMGIDWYGSSGGGDGILTATLGSLNTPTTAGSTAAKNNSWFSPATLPVESTLKEFKVYCSVAGTLKIKAAQPIKGGAFNIILNQTVTCAIGLNTFSVALGTLTETILPPYTMVGFYTSSTGGATVTYDNVDASFTGPGYLVQGADLSGNGVAIHTGAGAPTYATAMQVQHVVTYTRQANPQYFADENFAGTVLPAYFINNSTSPWVFTAGKATSAGTGVTTFLDIYHQAKFNESTFAVEFEFKAAGDRFCIGRKSQLTSTNGTVLEANLNANTLVIYNTWTGGALPAATETLNITTLTLATGVRYRLQLSKTGGLGTPIEGSITRISDNVTSDSFDVPVAGDGTCFGRPSMFAMAGSIDVFDAKFGSAKPSPIAHYIGDSILEGYNATVNTNSWVRIVIGNTTGQNALFSGDAGCTTLDGIRCLRTEIRLINAKYVYIGLGTNDSASDPLTAAFVTNIANIRTLIRNYGGIPVLSTCIAKQDAASNARIDATINPTVVASGEVFVDMHAAIPTWNATDVPDGTHPADIGMGKMALRPAIDYPQMLIG